MRSIQRLQLLCCGLGTALILFPVAAAASTFLMSGEVRLTTGPTIARRILEGGGVVTHTTNATAPATMMVPASFFKNEGLDFRVFPTVPSVAQVTSSFSSFNLAETLSAGGGPGTFTFCPPVGNPINATGGPCTQPNQATGGRNNFLQYTAGAEQFGGTFRVIQKIFSATVSIRWQSVPVSGFSHAGPPATQLPLSNPWAGGATMSLTQTFIRSGIRTSNPILGPNGSVISTGAVVGPGPPNPTSVRTGFPATTGMMYRRDTIPSPDTATLTGSDNRTSMGAGTIVLIGSGLTSSSPGTDFGREITVTLMPEPAISAAFAVGMASLVALYAVRRRF